MQDNVGVDGILGGIALSGAWGRPDLAESFPRAILIDDGSYQTEYRRGIRLDGSPEDQAVQIVRLDAACEADNVALLWSLLEALALPLVVAVEGDPSLRAPALDEPLAATPPDVQAIPSILAQGGALLSGHDAGRLWRDPVYFGIGRYLGVVGLVRVEAGDPVAYVCALPGSDRRRIIEARAFRDSLDGGPFLVRAGAP